jgi:polyribonucleotide nucleotidyltransferase
MKIPVDKIREVIGSGGKVIREIVEKTGAKVNIEDDGTIKIASADGKSIEAAIKWIKSIVSEAEVGMIYDGTVVKIMEFGAFVNFFGAKDGLVHISELAAARVQKVSDVVKEGDKVKVKFLGQDDPRQDPSLDEGRRPGDRRGPDRSNVRRKFATTCAPPGSENL